MLYYFDNFSCVFSEIKIERRCIKQRRSQWKKRYSIFGEN